VVLQLERKNDGQRWFALAVVEVTRLPYFLPWRRACTRICLRIALLLPGRERQRNPGQ